GPSRLFSADAQAMTAAATAGSFPRSFLIPGTDTSIRVGGNITWIADYYLEGGQANGSPWSTTIGANGTVQSIGFNNTTSAKGAADFGESMRQSQLSVETRTPTPYGEARSYLSMDWANSTAYDPGGTAPGEISDNLVPRMKYAYGTLGGWLAGQANSNFEDPDANAETLDFGGNVGEPGRVRTAQLRYTMPLTWAWGGALSFSLENSDVEVFTPNGICGSDAGVSSACMSPGLGTAGGAAIAAAQNINPAKPIAPDLTAALYIPQPWGHIDISGIIRPEGISDGAYYSKDFVGGGGHLGFDVKPGWFTPKDDFTFHFTGGSGLGGYLNSSTNAALETNMTNHTIGAAGACGPASTPTATVAPTTSNCVATKLIPSIGAEIGYQHWWSDNLRSTFSYGVNREYSLNAAYLGTGITSANKELQTAHANLIWNPVSFVTIGIEYMWGQRTVAVAPIGTTANSQQMQTLIGKFDVAF
ncbi:MAG TPA: DcaP family trimeric outer membrane transporter, partial [Stellaceae bacterium]